MKKPIPTAVDATAEIGGLNYTALIKLVPGPENERSCNPQGPDPGTDLGWPVTL